MGADFWNESYRSEGAVWGERPGILAQAARAYILEEKTPTEGRRLVDLGCGYGRDLVFLAKTWNCRGLGLDPAPAAVALAEHLREKNQVENVEFRVAPFQSLLGQTFDLVFVANLYQILPRAERAELCSLIAGILAPEGRLFLGTLSVRDPEHFGRGRAVAGEENSFVEQTFVHMSTEDELRREFSFLQVDRLYEREYLEPRTGGLIHHHVSWILIGRKPAGEGAGSDPAEG
jgi:SAM-dependent methyltransferase